MTTYLVRSFNDPLEEVETDIIVGIYNTFSEAQKIAKNYPQMTLDHSYYLDDITLDDFTMSVLHVTDYSLINHKESH